MVDRNDQTDVSEATKAQEALLHDVDPSLTDANDVAKALNVDPATGLSSDEAKRRLEKFGPNELASAPPVPKWKKFLAQFEDPLVYLLLGRHRDLHDRVVRRAHERGPPDPKAANRCRSIRS